MRHDNGSAAAQSYPYGLRWRRAFGLLTPAQRFLFACLTAARISVGLCDLALAAAMYVLFMLLQPHPLAHRALWIPDSILGAALLASILVVVRALIDVLSSRSALSYIQNLHVDLLMRLTQGYSVMNWSRFVARNRSELLHHSLNTAREAADFFHRCVELIAGVVVVVAMAAAFIYQSAAAALCFGLVLSAFFLLHRFFIRRSVSGSAANREASLTRLHKNLANLYASGKEIRTYGIHDFFQNRIRNEAETFARYHRRAVFLPQISRIVAEQGTVLLFLALIVAVQLQHGDMHKLLSLLAFYFVLSRRLLPLVSQISLIAGQMESSFENVLIVDSELTQCLIHWAPPLPALLPDPGFVLQIRQVSFSFQQAASVLRNFNLDLRKGETLVLHGVSGIGKSSLLNLIAGILQPTAGSIRVDRAAIAYVPQEVPLLDDSIRNNLLFGLAAQPEDALMRALAAANLAGFVRAQPDGLDTHIGDNGALLSGGQRQRLGLARAILRECPLLLLDEATSALDRENERQILANLASLGAAVLFVTHRRQRNQYAQRICSIRNGILIEESAVSFSARALELCAEQ